MKLNRKEFGLLVGVSGRTIEWWEQGRGDPSEPAKKVIDGLMRKRKS